MEIVTKQTSNAFSLLDQVFRPDGLQTCSILRAHVKLYTPEFGNPAGTTVANITASDSSEVKMSHCEKILSKYYEHEWIVSRWNSDVLQAGHRSVKQLYLVFVQVRMIFCEKHNRTMSSLIYFHLYLLFSLNIVCKYTRFCVSGTNEMESLINQFS